MSTNIYNLNYTLSLHNMAAADITNEEVVIDISKLDAPLFKCFTEKRAWFTTQYFGMNTHLLFRTNGKPFMDRLKTLQGRAIKSLKEYPADTTYKNALDNINLLFSSLGGTVHPPKKERSIEEIEKEMEIIALAASHKPLVKDDVGSNSDDEDTPAPPPRPSIGRK
jgi:hypothetical protein